MRLLKQDGWILVFEISKIIAIFAGEYMIFHIMETRRTAFERIISLGRRYGAYRKAVGISQQDVHRKTGVAMSTISLFENGKGQGLSLEHFYLLMEAVGLSVDEGFIIPEVQKTDLASLWKQQNNKGRK